MRTIRANNSRQCETGITRDDICRTAYELAESMGISERFGKSGSATKCAGKDWFVAFMKPHQSLSKRTTETMSYRRGAGLNCSVVKDFSEVLM